MAGDDTRRFKTRAEQVRSRRQAESRERALKKPKSSKPIPKSGSQVMGFVMRGGQAVLPVRSPRSSKTRRRIGVPFQAPDTEMTLLGLPDVKFGWRLVSGTMVLLLGLLLVFMWNAPMFRVSTPVITGLERVSPQEVNLVAGVTQKPIFMLNPETIQSGLEEAFKEFSAVSVTLQWPNGVVIDVVERMAVLALKQDNLVVWVDSEGVAFPPRGEIASLPIVEAKGLSLNLMEVLAFNGPRNARLLPPEMVSAALEVAHLAPQDTELLIDGEHGLGWKDPHGWEVYFGGAGEDINVKLNVYQALVERLVEEEIQPELISVEYVHAPYYRLER